MASYAITIPDDVLNEANAALERLSAAQSGDYPPKVGAVEVANAVFDWLKNIILADAHRTMADARMVQLEAKEVELESKRPSEVAL